MTRRPLRDAIRAAAHEDLMRRALRVQEEARVAGVRPAFPPRPEPDTPPEPLRVSSERLDRPPILDS